MARRRRVHPAARALLRGNARKIPTLSAAKQRQLVSAIANRGGFGSSTTNGPGPGGW